jgi:acyl-coenzyme A synthetase/AMP-(fatty) acid ligase
MLSMAHTAEIAWFRKPTPTADDPYAGGTLNLSYQLLDRPVVTGAADDLVLVDVRGQWSHARLLELVAAFGGVLAGFGVTPGDRVLVDLPDGVDAVVALLASARVGAVSVKPPAGLSDDELGMVVVSSTPGVVVTDRPGLPAAEEVAVVTTHREPAAGAVDWAVVMKAGRTDPAGATDVPSDAASALVWPRGDDHPARVRTAVEQVLLLAEATRSVPVSAAELVGALTR